MLKLSEKIKKYLCICTISSTLCQFIIPTYVYAGILKVESKKTKNPNDIENLRKEKENQNKNQQDLEAKIKLITNELNTLRSEIKSLKKENKINQDSISNISNKILNTTNEIAKMDYEIQNLTEETQELKKQVLKILRIIYMENGNETSKTPLSATSFEDFDHTITYSKKFSELFEKKVRALNEKNKEIDKYKKIKEEEIKKIAPEQQEIEQNMKQNNEKTSKIEKLMQECTKKYEELESLLKKIKIKTKIIEDAMKILENMNKKSSEKQDIPVEVIDEAAKKNNKKIPQTKNEESQKKQETPPVNSKGHIFPVLGNCSIFQGFRKGHPAIDIQTYGKPNPVVASKSGTVVVAARGGKANKMSGYGNVVVIDHGNGERTLYAHLSAFKVSAGQTVNQGQVIANVGNTGSVSGKTGMHLHYEQIKNGVRVNPTFGNAKPAPAPQTSAPQNNKNRSPNNTKSKSIPKNNKSKQGNKKK